MPDTMTAPIPAPAERRSQATFQALLWCLSFPGRLQTLEGDPYPNVAESLLDLEVGCFTADASLVGLLRPTGARLVGSSEADYLFFRRWDAGTLADLGQARVGTPLAPDESATLLLPALLNGTGRTFTLSGPGVDVSLDMQIGGVPGTFWALREAACQFPLGWDVFLIDGPAGLILGLPRTTRVEVR
jgi:alpha-D-ribose 1-methylphosphonate 5-triphosphate synthase subunit PhnH